MTVQSSAAGRLDRRAFLVTAGRVGTAGLAARAATIVGVTGTSLLAANAAQAAGKSAGTAAGHGPEVLEEWLATLYSGLMDEPGMTPGRAARVYATAAVAAHEALVPGSRVLRPLGGRLVALGAAPVTTTSRAVDWPLAASTAVATVAADVLRGASQGMRNRIAAQLTAHDEARRAAGVPAKALRRARTHGAAVGQHVADWCRGDGAEATYDRAYTPPVGPALWRSTPPNFGTAIDPYWGTVRPMALASADASAPTPHVPFSTDPSSQFRREADAVLVAADALTDAGRATALFWRDNPTTSGLPAGHWIRLAAQVCRERGLALDATAGVLAVTGVALSDAFVSCWHEKYTSNLLRPISYIQAHVPGRSTWASFVNTPQFPEYTSGHSVASMAAATVLHAALGRVAFTDRTHDLRNPQLGSRSYGSFDEAAAEAAGSRLLGGIHYPMGIDAGLVQGEHVGRTVLERVAPPRA